IDLYLRNRAAKGFTVVQCVLIGEIDGATTPNAEGNLPFEDLDVTKPNEDYFALVDYVVSRAKEYGLYLGILPTWGSHVEDKHGGYDNVQLFTPETAFAYGQFLGERWKDEPHIFWIFGGDRGPEGHEEIWDRMAMGTHKGDGGRLMTYHIYGGRSSSENFHNAPWLDFNMFQSGHMHPAAPTFQMAAHDYGLSPAKPVLDGEPCYEGMPIAFDRAGARFGPFEIRRASYWSVFAGGCGITYGHNSIWQMKTDQRNGIIGATQSWYEALDAPGSFQMRHLRNLMLSRPYFERIPDQSVLIDDGASWPAEGNEANHIRACRDGSLREADASYIMVYYPYFYRVKINTESIPGKELHIWWYSPRDGIAYSLGKYDNEGTFSLPWGRMITPGMGGSDWVLVIDDASKGYGPPGR
ncbi:MAG: glycoside hydrolase family 140 protein, partial [Bacteroidota bacterium]